MFQASTFLALCLAHISGLSPVASPTERSSKVAVVDERVIAAGRSFGSSFREMQERENLRREAEDEYARRRDEARRERRNRERLEEERRDRERRERERRETERRQNRVR